jgi:hypothetical protein
MGSPRTTAGQPDQETGAVLVLFAVFASVAILLAAFVLDVGNWFEHQRHLQVQADAAAFAAAQDFTYPCTAAVKQSIYQTAGQYGGAASIVTPEGSTVTSRTPLFNEQIGGTLQSNIHEVINKKTYFGQASEDKTVIEKPPCEEEGKEEGANMIDVKLTETNLPWFFQALNVASINAHARVSIVSQTKATAVLPAVESEPVAARVYFVNDGNDENNNEQDNLENSEVIASAPLTSVGPTGEGGLLRWRSTAVSVPITHPHIGIRIALAGKTTVFKENETRTEACWQKYVECFTTDNRVVPPLIHIAGYSEEGTATFEKPLARKVTLSKGASNTCSDGYFSNYLSAPTCTFTVSARVDYGSNSTTGMTIAPEVVAEATNKTLGAAMECKPTGAGTVILCTGTATAPGLGSSDTNGSNQINLVVTCKRESKAPCEKGSKSEEKHTLSDVQRIFSTGPDGSQRIVAAQVSEPEAAETPIPKERGANSYQMCDPKPKNNCTHKLVVTVDLTGSLRDAQKYSEGAYHIQYGDQDTDIDDQFVIACPPAGSKAAEETAANAWKENLAKGCKGTYKVNTTDPECKKGTEPPYGCVGVVNVPKTSVEGLNTIFKEGMSARIEKPPSGRYYCHNNWTDNNGGKVPRIPPDDSRLIQLFVVPYSVANSLNNAKSLKELPIEHFATFYVTGWPGDKCKLTKEEESKFAADDPAGPREIVGHLIKYVNVIGEGLEGGRCSTNPESIDTCVATLTQ